MFTPRRWVIFSLFFTLMLPILIIAYCAYFAIHHNEPTLFLAGIVLGGGVSFMSWQHVHES